MAEASITTSVAEICPLAILRTLTPATETLETFCREYSQLAKLAMLDRLLARLSRKVHDANERLHATATMINDFFMMMYFNVFIGAKIHLLF
jgi:hypothetical protein